jgi:hypothetical protein
LEGRVAKLEAPVAALQQLSALPKRRRWIDDIIGSMKDDLEFHPVVEFGREWRRNYDANQIDVTRT